MEESTKLEDWQLGPDRWPVTCDQAARDIIEWLDQDAIQKLRATTRQGLWDLHFSLGLTIRNRHGLWRSNKALLESCVGPWGHEDDASMKIIQRAWELVQGER